MDFVLHCFMPGHTIDAVLKLKNGHGLPKETMEQLRARFNELNNHQIIRPGMSCKIPLLPT